MEMTPTILFTIWTTSACNLKCKYCYEGTNKECNNMNFDCADDTISFIINIMKENPMHNIWVVFHGGEPCLNFSIIEYVVKKIKKKLLDRNIFFSLTTNATLIDNKKLLFLIDNIGEITVSLDGDKVTHDSDRVDGKGNGSFNKALSTALLLNETEVDTRIRMTVTAKNVFCLYSNIKFLIQCGLKTIVPVVDFFDSNWDEQLFEVLKQQLFLTKEYINEINDPDLCVAMTDADEMQEVGCCTGAINEFHIYPNGDIYPCVYTAGNPKYICGSVKTGIDKEKVDSYKKIYKTSIKQCEGCTYYRGCPSTRCKFLNEVLTGDLYTPSPAMCLTQNTCISVYHYL